MEITSLRWSGSLLNRENHRTPKVERSPQQESRSSQISFQLPDVNDSRINFSQITPRDLREVALQRYQAGEIDRETYDTLSEELPTHAVDAQGQVVDLTSVTDETGFNFRDYYSDQLEIAMSLGDTNRTQLLQSVMDFLSV